MGYEAGTASILWPALAPVGSHRWPGKSIESISFSVRRCLCFQGLTPVCGVLAAGNRAPDRWEQRLTRVRPRREKYYLQRSRHDLQNVYAIYVTLSGQGPKQGERRHTQYRGVDSTRRGKAPPLAILSPISHRGEIGPSGASPAGAQVCTCVIEMGQSLNKKGGRTFHRLFHLSYFAYWLRPILNRSLPWLSTATVRGRFSTSMRLTDSQPSSSKAMTWAVLMHLAMRAPAPPTAAK